MKERIMARIREVAWEVWADLKQEYPVMVPTRDDLQIVGVLAAFFGLTLGMPLLLAKVIPLEPVQHAWSCASEFLAVPIGLAVVAALVVGVLAFLNAMEELTKPRLPR